MKRNAELGVSLIRLNNLDHRICSGLASQSGGEVHQHVNVRCDGESVDICNGTCKYALVKDSFPVHTMIVTDSVQA